MMPLGPRGAVPVPTLVLDGALAEMKGKCSAGQQARFPHTGCTCGP